MASYEHAWATYWWFEDFPAFLKIYDEAAALARGTENVRELDLTVNLFNLVNTNAFSPNLISPIDLASRREALETELQRLASQNSRPSTSLQARALLIVMTLPRAAAEGSDVSHLFRQLEDIVRSSESLVGFPFQFLREFTSIIGDLVDDDPAFESLFEAVVEASTRRDGEITAGRFLLVRGRQFIQRERHYEAIRQLGRALGTLYKHETQNEAVESLYLCGLAYEQAGLLWAARGSFLVASSLASSRFSTYSEVTPQQALTYSRMKWMELRLGRIGHVLAWHEVDLITRNVLASKGYNPERIFDGDEDFDAALGILLLRADIDSLHRLERLPDTLGEFGLEFARVALLYALGHEAEVPSALGENDAQDEPLMSFFRLCRDQPAAKDISSVVQLYDKPTVFLESKVLGCLFRADVENDPSCIALAESLLASIEALLATGLREGIVAHQPIVCISIRRGDCGDAPFAATFDDIDGRLRFGIRCRLDDPHTLSLEVQTSVKDCLHDLLAQLLGRVFWMGKTKGTLDVLFGEQRAHERAVNFTSSFVVLGNVLGPTPKTSAASWCTGSSSSPLQRSTPWDSSLSHRQETAQQRPSQMGSGAPPSCVLNADNVSHKNIETHSVIRLPLWERAKWRAVGHIVPRELDAPPALVLGFSDGDAARRIFAGFREDLGHDDPRNGLRVTIVRGIDRANPSNYRVIVGSNIDTYVRAGDHGRVVMMSRILDVVQSSDSSLALFLKRYERLGHYVLMPGVLQKEPVAAVEVLSEILIPKRSLYVRDAWTIGLNDPDSPGISHGDSPVIPPEHASDAPILELLKKKASPTRRPSSPAAVAPQPGRNTLCPCGSRQKFKKCHGR